MSAVKGTFIFMKNEEQYNFTRASDKAKELKKKVDLGETSSYMSYEEAEKINDQELYLSPEAKKVVMAKVQDLGRPGIAFRVIGSNGYAISGDIERQVAFADCLVSGFKGSPLPKRDNQGIEVFENEEWSKNARKEHNAVVHFNITGRQILHREKNGVGKKVDIPPQEEISCSDWFNGLAITFDISKFKEEEALINKESFEQKNHTYRANFPSGFDKKLLKSHGYLRYDEQGRIIPIAEYGFVASFRVAPRFFTGIVIHLLPEESEIEEIIKIMLRADKEKPDLLLPIYDAKGNLLWPQKMSYEKVRKLTIDRKG